ncbi:hypothetical protein [Methylobacterium iners]|uniref:Uncharacterized protein n=1 Tax=Methylobacterium iners TaxID=418707 RepID=A0ABQ4RY95_9HYPH|nr:hypothetical protein [Methylobacterium iners]GJD95813.1 hypothetical protein OCOJLMKI_3028 [Methylobacterium iners]
MTGADRKDEAGAKPPDAAEPSPRKPANAAPDAVKDPSEKTEGMPGLGGTGGAQNGEVDPGGS